VDNSLKKNENDDAERSAGLRVLRRKHEKQRTRRATLARRWHEKPDSATAKRHCNAAAERERRAATETGQPHQATARRKPGSEEGKSPPRATREG